MNHKRGRPKNRRAGCLFCKGWKANGCHKLKARDAREDERAAYEAQQIQVASG